MKKSIKKSIFFPGLVLLVVLFGQSGCYYDKEDRLYPNTAASTCTGVQAKFAADVLPIMQTKCAVSGCHNNSSAVAGVVLENYPQVFSKAARINQRCVVEKSMPPNSSLSASEIATLKCWIGSGAPNN